MSFWIDFNKEAQLNDIVALSFDTPVVLFKHSTRCSISAFVKQRFDNEWHKELNIYLLDVLASRNLSNLVAEKLEVHHESPQILVIGNGECIFDESHLDIHVDEVLSFVAVDS